MGKRYLIDSNTLIEYTGKLLPLKGREVITEIINQEFNISFINKIEVPGHASSNEMLENFIDIANMYGISPNILEKTIELRKNFRIKIPDAIIASTALVNTLTLVTRNTIDFKNIPGLEIMNPWDIL